MAHIVFTLKQVGTSVPAKNVKDYGVDKEGEVIFVALPKDEGWIRINLADETFAVGAYEG